MIVFKQKVHTRMSSDQEPVEQPGPAFYVLKHNVFQVQDDELGASPAENLIYHLPQVLPDQTDHFLNVAISLYMYMKMCMEDSLVQFSMGNCKVAIRNFKPSDSDEDIFFILRTPLDYSDITVVNILDHIVNGLSFILGSFSLGSLTAYLSEHGSNIIEPVFSKYTVAFTSAFEIMPQVIWQRAAVLSSLASITAVDEQSSIISIACFVKDRLVTSLSDLSVVRYFPFAVSDSTEVHLSETIRSKLEKHDLETCLLTRVRHEDAVFYVLSETALDKRIENALMYAAKGIQVQKTLAKEGTTESAYYDSKLKILKITEVADASNEFKESIVYCHDEFAKDERLKEMIIKSENRLFYGGRFLSMECFTSVVDNGKSLKELYRDVITHDPEIKKYMHRLLAH